MEQDDKLELDCPVCFQPYSTAHFPHLCTNCTSRICSKCLLYIDKCIICRKDFNSSNLPKKDHMFLSLITNFKNMIKRQNSSLDTNTFVSCDMRVDKKNSKLYVGNTLGGKPDGKGKMYIGTNQLFIGEFKNSEPTENGKMYVLKCQGIWKDDSYAG